MHSSVYISTCTQHAELAPAGSMPPQPPHCPQEMLFKISNYTLGLGLKNIISDISKTYY